MRPYLRSIADPIKQCKTDLGQRKKPEPPAPVDAIYSVTARLATQALVLDDSILRDQMIPVVDFAGVSLRLVGPLRLGDRQSSPLVMRPVGQLGPSPDLRRVRRDIAVGVVAFARVT